MSEQKVEYLYECPKCGKHFWDSLYTKPFCVHVNTAYETRGVYHPSSCEDLGGIRVTREVKKE